MRTPEEMDALRDRVLLDKPDMTQFKVGNCPLCAGDSELRMMLRKFYAQCKGCGCAGPLRPTPEEAKQAWEMRDGK